MNAVHYTTLHKKLEQTMAQVCDDHNPVIITRNDQPSVVMISLEDYQSLEETAYLAQLRNSNEAAHQLMSLLEKEKQVQNV